MTRITNCKIGFIGAGNMAEAIIKGLLKAKLTQPDHIFFHDPEPARQEAFTVLNLNYLPDNQSVAASCEVLLLAVKPQVITDILPSFADAVSEKTLVISIMMGITCQRLEQAFGTGTRVVRVMPNTPMLVGKGVTGICAGSKARKKDLELTQTIFNSSGISRIIAEEQMHAVTALSGSGPAYFFYFTELLAKAGREVGMTQKMAEIFARETFIGAAGLLEKTSQSAEELRHKVTSKGGTTEAAINNFSENSLEKLVKEAVTAAVNRSKK